MPVQRSAIEARVANYLNRSDLTSYISDWFIMAYEDVQRLHNFTCMETTYTATLTNGVSSYSTPTDLKQPLVLYTYDSTTSKIIRFYSQTSITEILNKRTLDQTNTDLLDFFLYAIWGDMIEFWPDIGLALNGKQFVFRHYKWLDAPASGETSWFTNHAHDYLTYRSLRESAPFLGADSRLTTWKTMEDEALRRLTSSAIQLGVSGELVMKG